MQVSEPMLEAWIEALDSPKTENEQRLLSFEEYAWRGKERSEPLARSVSHALEEVSTIV